MTCLIHLSHAHSDESPDHDERDENYRQVMFIAFVLILLVIGCFSFYDPYWSQPTPPQPAKEIRVRIVGDDVSIHHHATTPSAPPYYPA